MEGMRRKTSEDVLQIRQAEAVPAESGGGTVEFWVEAGKKQLGELGKMFTRSDGGQEVSRCERAKDDHDAEDGGRRLAGGAGEKKTGRLKGQTSFTSTNQTRLSAGVSLNQSFTLKTKDRPPVCQMYYC